MDEFDKRGGVCEYCGYRGIYCHFDWAHKIQEDKEDNISTLMCAGSIKRLRPELLKCRLLCKLCHAEESTYDRQSNLALAFHVYLR